MSTKDMSSTEFCHWI